MPEIHKGYRKNGVAANNTDVTIDLLEQFIAVRRSSSTPEQSKDYFSKRGYSPLEIDTALRRVYSADKLNTQIPHSAPPLRGDDTPRSDTASPSTGLFYNIPADNQSFLSTSSLSGSALSPLVSRDSIDPNISTDLQSSELPIIGSFQDPKPTNIETSNSKEPVEDIPPIVENKLLAEATQTPLPVAHSAPEPRMTDFGIGTNPLIEIFKAPKEKLMPIEEHPTNINAASSANPISLLPQVTNELNQSTLHLVLRLKTSSNQLMEFSKLDVDPLEYCLDCVEEFTFNERIAKLVLEIQQRTDQDLSPAKLLQAHIVRILNFLEVLEGNPDYTSASVIHQIANILDIMDDMRDCKTEPQNNLNKLVAITKECKNKKENAIKKLSSTSEHSLNTTVTHSQNNPPILYMQHRPAKIQTGTNNHSSANNHSTTSGSNPIDTRSNRKDTLQTISPGGPLK